MEISNTCSKIIAQLTNAVELIPDDSYARPLDLLHGSTPGQHVRHIAEFLLALEKGYGLGVVSYDLREHNKEMETSKRFVLDALQSAKLFFESCLEDRPLVLESMHDKADNNWTSVSTGYFRELLYVIDHAIHHMAILRMAIAQISPDIKLDADFGMAFSTLHHQKKMNQPAA
ncbi:MAG: hypothetical protein FJZ78_04410 [Bacteroidetes bacterium]|nr:hypothetical protein [Bacteroidota bacterium]